MITESTPTLSRVERTDPMIRTVNQGLAVHWINEDLLNRANFNISRDIILYDEDRVFVGMLPIIVGPVLTPEAQKIAYEAGVRAYSVGIV